MKQNVGGWDRDVRWALGGAAIVAGLFAPVRIGWRIGLLAFGVSEFLTAGSRYCPVNDALGVNTLGEGVKSGLRAGVEALTE